MTDNKYPNGKLNEHDEGALTFRMATVDGNVVIDFGKPVQWIGLDKKSGQMLVDRLQERINEL